MTRTNRPYVLLYVTGLASLVTAMVLYQLVVEIKVIKPSFNLRPFYHVLCLVGVLFPLWAVLARPKALFIPAALFVLLLLSTLKHDEGSWGTMSNTWSTTSYGWPADYLAVHYHKGGNWSADNRRWIPYEERSLHINWWKTLLVIGTSVAGACILAGPKMLIEKRRANNKLHVTAQPLVPRSGQNVS